MYHVYKRSTGKLIFKTALLELLTHYPSDRYEVVIY